MEMEKPAGALGKVMVAVDDCPATSTVLLSEIVGAKVLVVDTGSTPLNAASAENGARPRTLMVRKAAVERRAMCFIA